MLRFEHFPQGFNRNKILQTHESFLPFQIDLCMFSFGTFMDKPSASDLKGLLILTDHVIGFKLGWNFRDK